MSISLFLVDERELEYPSSPPRWGAGAGAVLHLLYESASPNNSMQRTALRSAADAERSANEAIQHMEGSTIIFIAIGAFVIWALFIRRINPSNKTDDQLWTLYRMARPGTKELGLIQEEMERRGLLGDTSAPKYSRPSHEQLKRVAEASRIFEESGMQAEMQKMIASGLPEKMFNKIIEIAQAKGISESDASTLYKDAFEEASLKYQQMGLSQYEADEKATNEVLSKSF